MGRSQESFHKKSVRNKKEKKKKDKEAKRQAKKERDKSGKLEDMIAYVDENGVIRDTPPDPDEKEEIELDDIQISIPKKEDLEIDPIREGVVTFFNDEKGYGFIKDSETKESLFVHINDCAEEIKENNKVKFEVGEGQKGPVAIKVEMIRD